LGRVRGLSRLALAILCVVAPAALVIPSPAHAGAALRATFDSRNEGAGGTSFTDGGIRFFGLNQRIPDSPGEGAFAVERADGTLSGFEGFTPPNTLGFGGFVPGPTVGFGRVGEFKMSSREGGTEARLQLFEAGTVPGNVVTLRAIRHGRVLAAVSVTLLGNGLFELHHYTLSLRGVHERFDELRLSGSGNTDRGVFFALIDSVSIGG